MPLQCCPFCGAVADRGVVVTHTSAACERRLLDRIAVLEAAGHTQEAAAERESLAALNYVLAEETK